MSPVKMWTGKCLCHGIDVTGVRGTVAQPKPYYPVSLLGGPRVRCWAIVDGGVHDVPAKGLRESGTTHPGVTA